MLDRVLKWFKGDTPEELVEIERGENKRQGEEDYMGTGIVILNNEWKVLLCKRVDNGTWCTPGGGVEIGESPNQAIDREVKEETGIELYSKFLVGEGYTYDDRRQVIWPSYFYVARGWFFIQDEGVILQEEELSEYKWVEVDRLRDYNLFVPTEQMLAYIELNCPYFLYPLNDSDYDTVGRVAASPELRDYFEVDVEKLTAMEQRIQIANPGVNGGSGEMTASGFKYTKPGSSGGSGTVSRSTTGIETVSRHTGPAVMDDSLEAERIRQELLEWFHAHDVEVRYTLDSFPDFETLRDTGIVNSPEEHKNLFVEQYLIQEFKAEKEFCSQAQVNVTEDENVYKADYEVEFDTEISKAYEYQQIVSGKVLIPDKIDMQGDIISREEIEVAAHEFMINLQKNITAPTMRPMSQIGFMHTKFEGIGAFGYILESYIDPSGAWVMVTKITNNQVWKAILDKQITGYSIGGRTNRIPLM